MITVLRERKRGYLKTAVLAIPLLLFILLKLFPEADIQAWRISWYTRLIQFYAGSFAGLVALIAALFAGSMLGDKSHPRSMFATFAFVNISAMLLFSSIGTPGVIIQDTNREAFIWSLRFAFPLSAFFFFLAGVNWNAKACRELVNKRRPLWFIGILVLSTYAVIAFAFPQLLSQLNSFSPHLANSLAIISILLFVAAARQSWQYTWVENPQMKARLTIVLILLAEAQIFEAFGATGQYSWLLYHPVILAALIIVVSAILSTFESAQYVPYNRYFTALGSIMIGGLSLVIGELGTRWLNSGFNRTSVVALVLIQGALSFFVLLIIVMYLNRLIIERTQALNREQHLRSELTQLIVHDLKSPLSVITSGINLLTKRNLGALSETQVRLLLNLGKSGKQIITMIDDLLDVERLEAGVLKLQPTHLNLAKLLKEMVQEHQIIAGTHQQTLLLNQPALIPSVRADKRLLRRVLDNLMSNALKFTPQGGCIEVQIQSEPEWLVVQVADSGPGVPEADKERIFEKFAQVKGTERRGAGLGLTFCKMVVETHGGTLSVTDSPFGGALFEIKLPIPAQPTIEATLAADFTEGDWTLETY